MSRLSRLLVFALFCAAVPASANSPPPPAEDGLWFSRQESGEIRVTLYFFWSLTCPHCAKAQPFVEEVAEANPWLRVKSLEVTASAANRELFGLLATKVGEPVRGVPAFFVCGRMIVGFDNAEGIGARLGKAVEDCYAVAARQEAIETVASTPQDLTVPIPFVGKLDAEDLSLPLLTLALGGLDAFNPCAFFVLLFLLSLMVHARSRARMAFVGGVFVVFSGLLYFIFMAAWLNLFLVLESGRLITLGAGAIAMLLGGMNVKDFFAFHRGMTLGIPEGAKPGLFARMRGLISTDSLPALVGGTVVLATAANTYELLCTSGLPMVFTRILTLNELPASAYYLYLAAYNVIYVLPLLAIVVLFTVTLGARKLTEPQGRALKLLSGLMMLGLGLVLLIAPERLDNVLTAVLLLAAALIVTAAAAALDRLWRRRHAGP